MNLRESMGSGRNLYTPEQRSRRDATAWTWVQGVLAPIQFLVFAISLVLVVNFLANGSGYGAAVASVLIKTGILYTIMITGAIWEKAVFGQYLFAASVLLGGRREHVGHSSSHCLRRLLVSWLGHYGTANVVGDRRLHHIRDQCLSIFGQASSGAS